MMRQFHELRRHEEGQALVLAAICMLILTLCVLATVNLTYATSQKVRLQNAADAAAYTTAAYQARALNFFAYTNRAMVVQYCAQMNMMAILSYLMFLLVLVTALGYLPYIGFIFKIIATIMKVIVTVIDIIIALAVPAIDVMNYGVSLTQFAVSTAMLTRVALGASNEVRRYNPAYVVDPISSTLLGVNSALRWSKTVSASPMPAFTPPTNNEDKLNRAFMTEIANSGRHSWTAFGGRNGTGWPLIPRHASFGIGGGPFSFYIGKIARTEWGSYEPKTGGGLGGLFGKFLAGITTVTEQLYSIDQFLLEIKVFGFKISFHIETWVKADRRGLIFEKSHDLGVGFEYCQGMGRILGRICRAALAPIVAPLAAGVAAALSSAKISDSIPHFHFGQAPYARFRPGSRTWDRPSGAEMFNQPPVVLLVTQPVADLLSRGRPFMTAFSVKLGSLSSASSPLAAQSNGVRTPPKRGWKNGTDFRPTGNTLGFMQDGLHAMSAAMAYYHRPGDWREPPNLFSPFWGAKLMPVADYPLIANNPLLATLFNQKLMVH